MNLAVFLASIAALLLASVMAPAAPHARGSPERHPGSLRSAQDLDAEVQAFIRSGPATETIAPLGRGELVVLALNARPSGAALVAYVGDPALRPLRLPAGQWWLYILGEDGRVRQSRDALTIAVPAAISSLEIGRVDVPGDPRAQVAAVSTLVHFALASQMATWHPAAVVSEARAAGTMSQSHSDSLDGLAQAVAVRQGAVLQAAEALSQGAIGMPTDEDPRRTLRAASAGVWDRIKDSFLGFFTSGAMTGASAREDIQGLTQDYSAAQREALFLLARQRGDVDAATADEFFSRLADGAYDRLARQLHQDFIVGSEDYAFDAASGNLRPLDTGARDGAVLVRDGAQFYADVIKTVLGTRFGPDFDKGWELTQRIADRLTEVDNALKDPAAFARDLALSQLGETVEEIEGNIKDRMREKILDALQAAGIPEEEAERLAGEIADRVAEAGRDKLQEAATTIRDQVELGMTPPAMEPVPPPSPSPPPTATEPAPTTAQPPPPESPPEPATPPPTLTPTTLPRAGAAVSPSSGPQGTIFQLTGSGFQPGEEVSVAVSPVGGSTGALVADSRGMVQGLIPVMATTPIGPYTASLVGGTSGARATASFTVTVGATPTGIWRANAFVSPPSGPAGTTFQISGTGFGPGEQISVTVIYAGGVISATLVSDAFGQVVGSMQTNTSDPPGSYTATLTGTTTGAQAGASFLVSAGATPTPMPTTPPTVVPATPTPTEPYGVFLAGDDVLVGRRTEIENSITCYLRGWGIDCTTRVRDVTTVRQVIGPFPTSGEARAAYCGNIQAGSVRTVPLTGGQQKARFTFDGQEHWITNGPSC